MVPQHLLDAYKDTPRIIDPNPLMNRPNESIEIYSGELTLKDPDGEEYLIEGHITFNWFPHTASTLKGKIYVIAYSHSPIENEQKGEMIGLVDPEELDSERIINFVYQGIDKVQSSSQLFYGYD